MIESEQVVPPSDLGPPVLLKRLGNAVEANLAKAKLATAGVPSFLGGENVFAGDMMHPLPYREVELYVPQSMAAFALDVLEAPTMEDLAFEPIVDDVGRSLPFRAFVASVVGWMIFFVPPVGFAMAAVPFGYGGYLAVSGLRHSVERTSGMTANCVAALVMSAAGFVGTTLVAFEFLPR